MTTDTRSISERVLEFLEHSHAPVRRADIEAEVRGGYPTAVADAIKKLKQKGLIVVTGTTQIPLYDAAKSESLTVTSVPSGTLAVGQTLTNGGSAIAATISDDDGIAAIMDEASKNIHVSRVDETEWLRIEPDPVELISLEEFDEYVKIIRDAHVKSLSKRTPKIERVPEKIAALEKMEVAAGFIFNQAISNILKEIADDYRAMLKTSGN